MLASNETTLSFEKAIKEIDAIVRLAGLSWGYSLWDKCGEQHNAEIFLAWPQKVHSFSGDDPDEENQKMLLALVADDFAHLDSLIGLFAMYMIKASGAAKNPSPMFDVLYKRMSDKLNKVAEWSAAQFGMSGGLGKKLHKDQDMQRASDIIKEIANIFTKQHS
jgi:hypothetical protein